MIKRTLAVLSVSVTSCTDICNLGGAAGWRELVISKNIELGVNPAASPKLSWSCNFHAQKCGGFGDQFRGLATGFLHAVASQRLYFIRYAKHFERGGDFFNRIFHPRYVSWNTTRLHKDGEFTCEEEIDVPETLSFEVSGPFDSWFTAAEGSVPGTVFWGARDENDTEIYRRMVRSDSNGMIEYLFRTHPMRDMYHPVMADHWYHMDDQDRALATKFEAMLETPVYAGCLLHFLLKPSPRLKWRFVALALETFLPDLYTTWASLPCSDARKRAIVDLMCPYDFMAPPKSLEKRKSYMSVLTEVQDRFVDVDKRVTLPERMIGLHFRNGGHREGMRDPVRFDVDELQEFLAFAQGIEFAGNETQKMVFFSDNKELKSKVLETLGEDTVYFPPKFPVFHPQHVLHAADEKMASQAIDTIAEMMLLGSTDEFVVSQSGFGLAAARLFFLTRDRYHLFLKDKELQTQLEAAKRGDKKREQKMEIPIEAEPTLDTLIQEALQWVYGHLRGMWTS